MISGVKMNRNTTEIIRTGVNSRTLILMDNIIVINPNAFADRQDLRSVILNEGLIALE